MIRFELISGVIAAVLGVSAIPMSGQAASPRSLAAFHLYGIEAGASTLGYGGSIGTNLTDHLNLVISANGANYGYRDPSANGVFYQLHYRPRNGEARLQLFPFEGPRSRSFFFTAGAILTTRAWIVGKMTAPPGSLFTLNGTQYRSSASDPIYSSISVGSERFAYTFGAGWGNLVRGSHRLTFPIEVGVITLGEPQARVYAAGSVCDRNGANCRMVLNDAGVQANEKAEAERVVARHNILQYGPVVTIGIAYRFSRP